MSQMPATVAVALALLFAMGGCLDDEQWPDAEVPIQGLGVYDLGVADLDGDGRDDLFTVNHNARPTLLRSTGNALQPFEPMPALLHDPRFPALANLAEPPARPDSGALIYWHRGTLHVEAGHLDEPMQGGLRFWAQPVVDRADGSQADVERPDSSYWAVRFHATSGSHLAISHRPFSVAGWPVTLTLDSDPADVSIGRPGDHPGRETTFRLQDYHALVVRDLNSDGRPDVIALGGGLRGRAAEIIPDARENVFIAHEGGYTAVPGPPKDGCATRGAWWEGDSLHVRCARGQPNNVWVWKGEGWMEGPAEGSASGPQRQVPCDDPGVSEETRQSLSRDASCIKGDFDGDGALELVVATPGPNDVSTAMFYDLPD